MCDSPNRASSNSASSDWSGVAASGVVILIMLIDIILILGPLFHKWELPQLLLNS